MVTPPTPKIGYVLTKKEIFPRKTYKKKKTVGYSVYL